MHFVTALTLVASASTLVSARLDQVRRHGDSGVGAPHLAARAPVPEPFRLFPAPGASENPQHGSASVSHDALEALLVPVHPASPELSKRSDSPKKGSKCHKKKRPASAKKAATKSAGQILAAAPKSDSDSKKEAAHRQTWAEKQRAADSKKAADDEQKAKDEAKPFTSDDSKQLAAAHKSSDKGEEKKDKEKTDSLPVFDGGAKTKGLIGFTSSNCGPSGANEDQPNGSEEFLACGLSKSNPSSVWRVPEGVTLDNLKTVSIEHALEINSVWEPCKPFIPLFEKYAAQTGLPPILLASIALQESTCNPHVLGDSGGAFGLMQITEDKCGGRDAKGCSDPDYNVRTGAEYFKKELDNAGGSFLEAAARYNGWIPNQMSYSSATAAAYSGCCHCQNNLDYLFQLVNGWMVGKTGYELGSYKNLAVCD